MGVEHNSCTSIVNQNYRMKVFRVILAISLLTLTLAFPSERIERERISECRAEDADCYQDITKRETNECTGEHCNHEKTKRETEECTGEHCEREINKRETEECTGEHCNHEKTKRETEECTGEHCNHDRSKRETEECTGEH